MVRYVFCVERNFTSVIVMGIRTAMERKKARVREMMRRWRMRDLRACVVRRYQSASSFSFSSIRFYSLSFSFSFGLGRDWLCCGFSTYSIPMHHSIQVLQIALPIIKPPILTLHIHFPPVSVSVSGKSRGRNTGSEKVLLVLVADGQRMLAVICLCGHGEAATRGGCWCYRCLVFFFGIPWRVHITVRFCFCFWGMGVQLCRQNTSLVSFGRESLCRVDCSGKSKK